MKTAPFLILIALFGGAVAAQDQALEALRRGIVEEDSIRNLSAAIQDYQSALAQPGVDRQTAATAMFRIAECYRKLGKGQEAIAAYNQVARDYADQTRLAEQSRKQLSATRQATAQEPGAPSPTEARRQYRQVLEEMIKAARSNWDYISKQFQLGAVSVLETYEPQALLARYQSELAAFEAGLIPQQPAGPQTPEARAARSEYRARLEEAIRFSQMNVNAMTTQYQLGAAGQPEVVAAQTKLFAAKRDLAAFDAGLARVPEGK